MKKILISSLLIINVFLYGQDPGIIKVENRSDLVPLDLERISRVTGKSLLEESLPNPNHTDELYDVGGTDLGIMWEMEPGRIGIFFGDTFGKNFKIIKRGGGNGGNWRSNVLAFSDDNDLDDGISFSGYFHPLAFFLIFILLIIFPMIVENVTFKIFIKNAIHFSIQLC